MSDLLQPVPVRSLTDRLTALRERPWARPVVAGGGAVLAVGLLVVAGLALLRSSSPPPALTLPRAEPGSAPAAADGGSVPTSLPGPPPVTVTVHVAGQVVNPGVYAVPAGGRVADVVVAAGGAAAEADLEQLNLAARVSDGERIHVPKKGEPPPVVAAGPSTPAGGGAGKAAPAGGPVDLNTATAEQLEALPGVGPATSRAILAYRSSHGRFRSVTELLEVPGIGPAKLEALRPLVRV